MTAVHSLDEARARQEGAGGRVPPHNLQAEESLLGAMMLSAEARAAGIGRVRGDDFYKPAHAHIFEAICDLDLERGMADAVLVGDLITRRGLTAAIGGLSTLVVLTANCPATTNAGRYARIVAEMATLRRFISAASEIAEMAYDLPENVGAVGDRMLELVQWAITGVA